MTQIPTPPDGSQGFIKRELNGASFLSLEHVGHMALAVIVPGIITSGLGLAFAMWFGSGGFGIVLDMAYFGGSQIGVPAAISAVAALLITAPLLVLLGRRTRAEWHKRQGYAGRLAYKLPLYTALAAATLLAVSYKIQIISVFLSTLALIGVRGASFGALYGGTFLPALIGLLGRVRS